MRRDWLMRSCGLRSTESDEARDRLYRAAEAFLLGGGRLTPRQWLRLTPASRAALAEAGEVRTELVVDAIRGTPAEHEAEKHRMFDAILRRGRA